MNGTPCCAKQMGRTKPGGATGNGGGPEYKVTKPTSIKKPGKTRAWPGLKKDPGGVYETGDW